MPSAALLSASLCLLWPPRLPAAGGRHGGTAAVSHVSVPILPLLPHPAGAADPFFSSRLLSLSLPPSLSTSSSRTFSRRSPPVQMRHTRSTSATLSTSLPLRATLRMTEPSSDFLTPLYDFTGEALPGSLSQWERIDDVIMGGISSSRLVGAPDGSCALFEGKLREMGGGFCGQRMRLLEQPIDLSNEQGLWVDLEADADASLRVFKMALRTKQDRGEVIYQTSFEPPPLSRTRVLLPFSDFKLVRGPRIVPGVPPLSAANATSVYQLSLIVSKFKISEDGAALPGFKEGPFRTKLYGVGVFRSAPTSVAGEVAKPRAMTEEAAKAARPLALKLLSPLLGLLFGEARRRRLAAGKILQQRGSGPLARARLGWAWRRAGGRRSAVGAALKTGTLLAQEVFATLLAIPFKLLSKIVFTALRTLNKLRKPRGLVAEARKAQPKL